jgi:hypothetical protein
MLFIQTYDLNSNRLEIENVENPENKKKKQKKYLTPENLTESLSSKSASSSQICSEQGALRSSQASSASHEISSPKVQKFDSCQNVQFKDFEIIEVIG